MGRRDFRHVQLSAERLPNQEWWLSILAAALFIRALIDRLAGWNGEVSYLEKEHVRYGALLR
jgi:hypothetical protein